MVLPFRLDPRITFAILSTTCKGFSTKPLHLSSVHLLEQQQRQQAHFVVDKTTFTKTPNYISNACTGIIWYKYSYQGAWPEGTSIEGQKICIVRIGFWMRLQYLITQNRETEKTYLMSKGVSSSPIVSIRSSMKEKYEWKQKSVTSRTTVQAPAIVLAVPS